MAEEGNRQRSVSDRSGKNKNKKYTELCEPMLAPNDTGTDNMPVDQADKNTFKRSIRKRLKRVRAGFSNEVVADSFIDSSNNVPRYMKGEYSNSDLLV